jgi:glycosyltransferase involved in cell wall biosynthesis
VGQRGGYKNFNLLLSAYSRDNELNKNYKLICFGGGNFNLSEKLFIKTNKLFDKVHHMSGSDKLLVSLYKYADVFVYTSLYEGFGFPPLEAMECGCPVLTSPGGSVKEIAGDAALYFDAESHEDLLNKLYEILNNAELRSSYIIKGKQRAAMFTWEKCVSEHMNFYKEILQ